jgi:hypothetical protein
MAAQAASLPYPTVSPAAFPDATLVATEETADTLTYPDADPEALVKSSYRESQPWQGQVYGLVTLETNRSASAALVYYSPSGWAAVPLEVLPVLGSQSITLSTRLPQDDAGLLRLLLFERPVRKQLLFDLAREPDFGGGPIPGLLAQVWYARTPGSRLGWGRLANPPWLDVSRPLLQAPAEFANQPWPAALVWIGPDLKPRCKDASLALNSLPSLTTDNWGLLGEWSVSSISEMAASFSLPENWAGANAHVYVFARSADPFQLLPAPDFQFSVNGWSAAVDAKRDYLGDFGPHGTQPFAFDVSQNLSGGLNVLRLRLSPLSAGEWRISGIQVWTD